MLRQALLCAAACGYAAASLSCNMAALEAPLAKYGATIINATAQTKGAYNVAGYTNNVAFCEVDAVVPYGNNDSMLFQVWLPDEAQYQQRFMAVGNGGQAGSIDTASMLLQLNSGYGFAVAAGNGGHLASDNNGGSGSKGVYLPFLHDQDQVNAWIHDAISIFTPAAKGLAASYYGSDAKYAYYDGCSTGGAQGFALAQYHPDLFDGIVAGSPGNWYSHLALSFLWNAQYTATPETALPQTTLAAITNAVLDACDSLDGVADRLIENPLACQFDVATLACSQPGSNASTCLTSDQLDAVRAIYHGPVRSCGGEQIYPGLSFGSEVEWGLQEGYLANTFAIPILQNLVYNDLTYDPDTFNYESDVDDVDERAGRYIDEKSADLSAFHGHGGKLLVTQGWSDPFNAATWPIEQLGQIEAFSGGDVSDFFRLFMVPGGGHCGAAAHYPDVPATYQTVDQLVKWVEQKQIPQYVVSTGPTDGSNQTRRLCAWPQTAKYQSGSIDDWTSYTCS